jgi:hypothetical protein
MAPHLPIAAAALLLTALSSLPSPASSFSSTTLFTASSTDYPNCFRQPVLVQIPPSTLLAIVEGRPYLPDGYCAGTSWPDTPSFPLLARRSDDNGATWDTASAPTTVAPAGNLDFYVAVHDALAGVTHALIQLGDTGVVHTSSSDAGRTWSPLVNITIAGVAGSGLQSAVPGVGHGLQISPSLCLDPSCAGTAGRLVLPFVCTLNQPANNDTVCGDCSTCLVYSDDSGATWTLGAISTQSGSRESSLAQMPSASFSTTSGVIYATERNLGNATGTRWHSVSTDGGRSFNPTDYSYDPALPDGVTANWTGVVSGLARPVGGSAVPGALPEALLFTAPASRTARANLTVFAGAADASAWNPEGTLLWNGPSAYSDALVVNATHVCVVFECGTAGGDFAAMINVGLIAVGDLPAVPSARA